MSKINVDLSKSKIDLTRIAKFNEPVKRIHQRLKTRTVDESDWLAWLDLPNLSTETFGQIKATYAKWLAQKVDLLVVIGADGSYLGAKAGYEFIFNNKKDAKIELMFTGDVVSSEALATALKYAEDRKFAINVISKSGSSLETAITFREFRHLIEKKYGTVEAKEFIAVTTQKDQGALFKLTKDKGYQIFLIPDDVITRFSIFSPAGLLPLLCSGINIKDMIEGAKEANLDADNEDLMTNYCYQYAVARYIHSINYQFEMMNSCDVRLKDFIEWWKQLFSESEAKTEHALIPISAMFSSDLHISKKALNSASTIVFKTLICCQNSDATGVLATNNNNLPQYRYLDGKYSHPTNDLSFDLEKESKTVVSNIPNIIINIDDFTPHTLGYLFQFFMRSVVISAYLLEVNPFNQPGVEVYKDSMQKLLNERK
ncbi:glucose-6-phosphate isomerase [Mycoplasmopsis opalescens]|uniref:hypothetical protein n=1 Tax=Mycoplasmopsis opalescens TaxID=114886 RepID=UPI0004A6E62E|nr:hypothetical protein [Mycoplasmopsis opalescens]